MSIKIEINAENGADARAELLDLLGITGQCLVNVGQASKTEVAILSKNLDEIGKAGSEAGEKLAVIVKEINEPIAEEKKRTRRTKAEIEAEALKANTGSEEPPASAENTEAAEQPKADEFPTLEALKQKCAIMVRAGYKDQAVAFIKDLGGAENSVAVTEDKRQAVIDAIVKFAKENKIAL